MQKDPRYEQWIRNIGTTYYACAGARNLSQPRELVDCVHAIGGNFVDSGRKHLDPNPVEAWAKAEHLALLHLEHPDLQHDIPFPSRPWGSGSLFVSLHTGYVGLSQDMDYTDSPTVIEAIAAGQLALAKKLYTCFQPAFACIDIHGKHLPTEHQIRNQALPTILWANFFGPEYVAHYGKEYLLAAPGWYTEVLEDGGVLYVISPRFLQREAVVSMRQIITYFRRIAPRVKAYRAKPFPGTY